MVKQSKNSCANCAYQKMSNLGGNPVLVCRESPPVPIVVIQEGALRQPIQAIQSVWPIIDESMWCGKHQVCEFVGKVELTDNHI